MDIRCGMIYQWQLPQLCEEQLWHPDFEDEETKPFWLLQPKAEKSFSTAALWHSGHLGSGSEARINWSNLC